MELSKVKFNKKSWPSSWTNCCGRYLYSMDFSSSCSFLAFFRHSLRNADPLPRGVSGKYQIKLFSPRYHCIIHFIYNTSLRMRQTLRIGVSPSRCSFFPLPGHSEPALQPMWRSGKRKKSTSCPSQRSWSSVHVVFVCIIRMLCGVTFFAPFLGLGNLLAHWVAEGKSLSPKMMSNLNSANAYWNASTVSAIYRSDYTDPQLPIPVPYTAYTIRRFGLCRVTHLPEPTCPPHQTKT